MASSQPVDGKVETVRRGLHRHAAAVRDEQVVEALERLESRGDLSPRERETVAAMADAIVAEVVAGPERALADASDDERAALAATAEDLFDLEATDGTAR